MIKFDWSDAWERLQELKTENGKLKEENKGLINSLIGFKIGYGSTNNKELKEENRQLRALVEDYTKRNENYQTKVCDLNKEINYLKKGSEILKFGDQKFSYLDELIKINKESLKEKIELKNKVIELENRLQNIKEMARL